MSTVAIAPNTTGRLRTMAINDRQKWVAAKAKNSYSWSTEYTKLVWSRIFIVLFMLGGPVLAAALLSNPIGMLGLLGMFAVPVRDRLIAGQTSKRYSHRQAHEFHHVLKDGWKDHGDVFYKQVWEHDCDGSKASTDYYDTHDWKGDRKKNLPTYTECRYCDKRIKELKLLKVSQEETERSIREPIENELFESSEQFRKAIAAQPEVSAVMKEISNGVSKGQVHRTGRKS